MKRIQCLWFLIPFCLKLVHLSISVELRSRDLAMATSIFIYNNDNSIIIHIGCVGPFLLVPSGRQGVNVLIKKILKKIFSKKKKRFSEFL